MRLFTGAILVFSVMGCDAFRGITTESPQEDQTEPPPPAKTPEQNAEPPRESVTGEPIQGIFVSASKGKDEFAGSMGRPLRTLKSAIARAKKDGLRVVACAEEYAENVELVDAVSMYGTFDCSAQEWRRVAKRAVVRAPASPAVVANQITQTTRIDGFEFRAPDVDTDPPSETARSSIGIEIRGSKALTFGNVLVHAGNGAPGANGGEGTANVEKGTPLGLAGAPQGQSNTCPFLNLGPGSNCSGNDLKSRGSYGGTSLCQNGASGGVGGDGGDGKFYRADCTAVASTTRNPRGRSLFVATATTARGGDEFCVDPIFARGKGENGTHGADGPDGANGAWALGPSGFLVGNGTKGGDGSAGQGGGGGGGREDTDGNSPCSPACRLPALNYQWTAVGAGGGAGGCAGMAGTAGFGGGASIAVLVVDGAIRFEQSKLESATGGAPGSGTLGSNGLVGGNGGAGTDRSGAGGTGGSGGAGGLSGHGAPGPSIALAYHGPRPTMETTELAPGRAAAGRPRLEKAATNGTKTLPRVDGESKAEQAF